MHRKKEAKDWLRRLKKIGTEIKERTRGRKREVGEEGQRVSMYLYIVYLAQEHKSVTDKIEEKKKTRFTM